MTSDAKILASSASARENAGVEGSSPQASTAGGSSPQASTDPRRWLTLLILLLAAFMNLLDVSIVNIAIPSIQRNLGASHADVQWTLAGFTLAYALVLITGGRLGDTYGRKRLFLIGVAGFTVMSALCGAAQSPGQLIAFRVVQGAMGGIMIPQVLAVIQVRSAPACTTAWSPPTRRPRLHRAGCVLGVALQGVRRRPPRCPRRPSTRSQESERRQRRLISLLRWSGRCSFRSASSCSASC